MKKSTFAPVVSLLAVLVFMAGACFAFPYEMGEYKVDVTVRNSAMNLIPGIKVALYRFDKATILIEAVAAGYQRQTYKMAIRENQFYYKHDMVLPDPEREIVIVDHNDKVISSAYIRKDQYGFPGDHYGVTAYIPVQMWPDPVAARVDVFDSFWGVPLKKSCEITQVEEFYCVKMSITRKALKWGGSRLAVVFRTSKPASPAAVSSKLARLETILAGNDYPAGAEEAMACYLSENYSLEELTSMGCELPGTLRRLVDTRTRFAEVHHENYKNF